MPGKVHGAYRTWKATSVLFGPLPSGALAERLKMTCIPHVWNTSEWLPIVDGSRPEAHDSIRCLNCGRVLKKTDMTQNMRASIANSLALRMFGGDEFDEVYTSASGFLNA